MLYLKDACADKSSLGSGRSFRSSERSYRDDIDSTSLSSSTHKRMNLIQRIPKLNNQHRNLSLDSNNGSCNIPENVSLEQESMTPSPLLLNYENEQLKIVNSGLKEVETNKFENSSEESVGTESIRQMIREEKSSISDDTKNMSKTTILRNLFFFQNEGGSNS